MYGDVQYILPTFFYSKALFWQLFKHYRAGGGAWLKWMLCSALSACAELPCMCTKEFNELIAACCVCYASINLIGDDYLSVPAKFLSVLAQLASRRHSRDGLHKNFLMNFRANKSFNEKTKNNIETYWKVFCIWNKKHNKPPGGNCISSGRR